MRKYISHKANLGVSDKISRVRNNTLCGLLVRDYNDGDVGLVNNLTNQIPLGNYSSNYKTNLLL